MALFGLVFLVVVLALVGVGIAAGLIGSAILMTLAALGIVSSSVLIGLRSGRFENGLQALLIQCGVFGGLPAGAACAWAYAFFWATGNLDWRILICGALAGALAGLLVALMANSAGRHIFRRLTLWWGVRQS